MRYAKTLAVLVLLGGTIGGYYAWSYYAGPIARDRAGKERARESLAKFEELCKGSGVRITRTDSDVRGILLMKVRPEDYRYNNQYEFHDPYGNETGGDGYIMNFLRDNKEARPPMEYGREGYEFVDVINPADGRRYRYTALWVPDGRKNTDAPNVRKALERDPNYDLNIYRLKLRSVPATEPAPRYGITYDDLSTYEQRSLWIAGSSLRIIDLGTNEVIAERIGYLVDPARGSLAGARSPWLEAAKFACPEFPGRPAAVGQVQQASIFAKKVLTPTKRYESTTAQR